MAQINMQFFSLDPTPPFQRNKIDLLRLFFSFRSFVIVPMDHCQVTISQRSGSNYASSDFHEMQVKGYAPIHPELFPDRLPVKTRHGITFTRMRLRSIFAAKIKKDNRSGKSGNKY